jgi:putative hydrolase of the HAD superfamily
MTRIEAVISDFGGVLTTPLMQAFADLQAEHGLPPAALGTALAHAAETNGGTNPLFELETGKMTEARFIELLRAGLERELGRPVELEGFGTYFFKHLRPNEELFAFMRTLHGRGYRMAILTNNVREWEPLWRPMLPIDEIFDLVVDSGFVGVRKPDPAIYQLTLERLGLPAEATLFLDDMEINCDAARELGINAVHFRTTAQAIADIEATLANGRPAA